ncbi:DUF1622 domain-containing protein [Candidatus Bathyarchaeota archaeon]|nr:DUF1622 domain-containing protein [Candidatus Bathyarchaeota archaeon]
MNSQRVQSDVETERFEHSNLTITLMVIIAVLAALGVIFTPRQTEILSFFDETISTLLNVATEMLYLLGGALIFFGVLLISVRFIKIKLKDPYKPSGVSRFLSGYLTLSLEFFIGAEIIKTVIVRDPEEFYLLILVIFSRGLFSLILFLERRWHGTAETE